MTARRLLATTLGLAGGLLRDDGSVVVPVRFFVSNLRENVGVFAVYPTGAATYSMRSLEEVEAMHKWKDDAFSTDVLRAIAGVRKGSYVVFILCAHVDGDAFTQLCAVDAGSFELCSAVARFP